MSNSIPKEILDELTNVKMPGRVPGRKSEESIVINGLKIPVFQCTALVAGSGAAGKVKIWSCWVLVFMRTWNSYIGIWC